MTGEHPQDPATAAKSPPVRARRRWVRWLAFLLAVDVLALAHEPLLIVFGSLFRADDPPARSDAIVVLLGSPGDRARKAAELYRQGVAPLVLMSRVGGEPQDGAEANRRILTSHGVPDGSIQVLPGGAVENTHDEALRVRDYMLARRFRRVTVVTTAFHSARARWTFRKVLRGAGVEVRMAASELPGLSAGDWYANGLGWKVYLMEALKALYYRLAY